MPTFIIKNLLLSALPTHPYLQKEEKEKDTDMETIKAKCVCVTDTTQSIYSQDVHSSL